MVQKAKHLQCSPEPECHPQHKHGKDWAVLFLALGGTARWIPGDLQASHPSLPGRPFLKQKNGWSLMNHAQGCPLSPPHEHFCLFLKSDSIFIDMYVCVYSHEVSIEDMGAGDQTRAL